MMNGWKEGRMDVDITLNLRYDAFLAMCYPIYPRPLHQFN